MADRRAHLGWYSYDPELNLVYYARATRRPGTREPSGRQPLVMTIWARNLDTGAVKWVYQLTPHDEWDYDAINEVILADQEIGGVKRKTRCISIVTVSLYARSHQRRIAGRREIRPGVNGRPRSTWTRAPDYAALVVDNIRRRKRRGHQHAGRLPAALAPRTSNRPRSIRKPACSMCRPTTSAWTTSLSGQLHAGQPTSARRWKCSGRPVLATRRTTPAISSPGTRAPARSFGPTRSSSPCGPARSRPLRLAFYGTLEGYLKASTSRRQELYKFKTRRHHRQRHHLRACRQAYVAVLSASAAGPASVSRGLTKGNEVRPLAIMRRCPTTPLLARVTVFALPN